MNKIYIFALSLALIVPSFGFHFLKAQLTNLPSGSVAVPQVSTADAPVWYNVMSSHLTVADRQNRFLTLTDGGNLPTTEKFDTGISDSYQNDKYLWRLEQGASGNGYVYFVNKASGKRLTGPANMTISNVFLNAGDTTGIEWKMATSASTGLSTQTTENQYCFNFEGGTTARYLNATDATNAFKLVTYNAGVHQASGWFFYQVLTPKGVAFEDPANGKVEITATNGTKTPTVVLSGDNLLVGTQLTVKLTPNAGYQLESLLINDVDVTAQVTANVYKHNLTANAVIMASFKTASALPDIRYVRGVHPTVFRNSITVENALKGSPIRLMTLNGQEVLNTTNPEVNTTRLRSGSYILEFHSAEGIKSVKVVKK